MGNITIKGANENNLKNVDLTIPRGKLVVFTGLSGSGKSSLAFDTIFAEGQRRYMESLSSYARQFLGQMEKPNVEMIDGLSPAIAIDQKTTSHNPRSTVGTVTEIYDYLRLLYARVGTPHCPKCGRVIEKQSVDVICDKILKSQKGKVIVMAPVVRGRKGEYVKQIESYKKAGYTRVRIDGIDYTLDEELPKLEKNVKHTISVVVDRLVIKEGVERRLTDSLELALKLAEGLVTVDVDGTESLYSTNYSCPDCDISIEELSPRSFSFNNPYGACPECLGLGYKCVIDTAKLVKDDNLSIDEGALAPATNWGVDVSQSFNRTIKAMADKYGFSTSVPFKDLPKEAKKMIFYGNDGEELEIFFSLYSKKTSYKASFDGIVPILERRYKETTSEMMKAELDKLMVETDCDVCHGKRLKKEVLAVTVGGKNIIELTDMSVVKIAEFFKNLSLTEQQQIIAKQIIKEITARLNFLINVGLDYLTLSRTSMTLSGGESQRIRLATQIGSGLTGVLYILDEPSIGLHQKDNSKLLASLKGLRDLDNTLIVVEHDEETIRSADFIVDVGPGAGIHGGNIVATGSVEDIINCKESITGKYLSGELKIEVPKKREAPDGRYLVVKGAKQNNLKNVDVKIPVGLFTCITGVSGSGKSSLVNEIIYPRVANAINRSSLTEGKADGVEGLEYFDKVISIDQSPIGRTPRSNPATYTGVFTAIRELFAATPDSKARGYKAGRYSFNIAGGRCESCSGDGIIRIAMHFLADVYVPCEVCHGKRYNRETLEVKYKGKNIFEVLDMTVEEACDFFRNIPSVYNKIKTLKDVGLGYIKLGQSSTTLSGGEAQRVKLATELSKRSTGKTLYILDEPTTGLHSDDVSRLVDILKKFSENGNTVLVIEHNLDVIKVADYIVDLGPDGGDRGGNIVGVGTPEEIAEIESSYTGEYLKPLLQKNSDNKTRPIFDQR